MPLSTSVYVTHGQAEAMVMSDRIVVMNAGNVVQIGTPDEIYEKPADRFVADFIGTMNFIPGEVTPVPGDAGAAYVKTEFSEKLLCKIPDGMAVEQGKDVSMRRYVPKMWKCSCSRRKMERTSLREPLPTRLT